MSDFLSSMVKSSGNKYASLVSDGLDGSDVGGFVDTGCYIFNGLLSANIYGGLPNNKILAIAGESSTGKTYFTLGIVSKFLTEQAVTSEMFKKRGIDPKRVAVFPVATIEEFRHQAITIVDKYLELAEEDRKPTMIVLDSLGMLSTSKEMNDTAEGKETRDMTRAQIVKSTFRVLTVKLGIAKIPMIMTNHTYQVVGAYVPMKEMGGGSGLKYAASTIIYLSKKKDKVDNEVVGNIIHCKTNKSRMTKQDKMIDVQLNFETGLNKYYGLLDVAIKYGIFTKVSTKIQLPTGKTAFESQINRDPEKYYTPDVLAAIEVAVKKEFCYGTDEKPEPEATTDEE